MAPLHRQVEVEVAPGHRFEVDEGLAGVVRALWERGYRTISSCEEQPGTGGHAWIGFTSMRQASKFAGLVGGTIVEPSAAEVAEARATNDPFFREGAVAVAFPAAEIQAVADALASV